MRKEQNLLSLSVVAKIQSQLTYCLYIEFMQKCVCVCVYICICTHQRLWLCIFSPGFNRCGPKFDIWSVLYLQQLLKMIQSDHFGYKCSTRDGFCCLWSTGAVFDPPDQYIGLTLVLRALLLQIQVSVVRQGPLSNHTHSLDSASSDANTNIQTEILLVLIHAVSVDGLRM